MATRCASPPESSQFAEPKTESYPSGNSMILSWTCAAFAASTTSSSVASGRASRMLSRRLTESSMLSWNTIATLERSVCVESSRRSMPPKVTLPDVGSQKRGTRRAKVVLPLPESPTSAQTLPGSMHALTRSSAREASGAYLKQTSSKRRPIGSKGSSRGSAASASRSAERTASRCSRFCPAVRRKPMPDVTVSMPIGMDGPSTRKGTQPEKSSQPQPMKRLLARPRKASIMPGEMKPPNRLKGPAVSFVHSKVTSHSRSTASR